MVDSSRIQILFLGDERRNSFVSIEPSVLNGELRLFKEISGSSAPSSADNVKRMGDFISSFGARSILFEDDRSRILQKLLRKAGLSRTKTYPPMRGLRHKWRAWNSADLEETALFGVSMDAQLAVSQSTRRLFVTSKEGPIGELVFSDHGRFVRMKANRFGSEGYGRVFPGKDPSLLLLKLAEELFNEGKRYLILGPEHQNFLGRVHPFPLWHMTIRSPVRSNHECRFADKADLPALVRLVSEYEDIEPGAAYLAISKNFENKAFKYIIDKESLGFSLVKFMEGAEGMVNDLYVTPKGQGRGIGDELTRASVSALADNCITIHLNTIYPRAKRLYEKHGFSVQYQDFCVALKQTAMVR